MSDILGNIQYGEYLKSFATRKELAKALAARGYGRETIELIARATAPARHAWRVEQTIRAARDYLSECHRTDSGVIALLCVDIIGIGSWFGRTDRLPCFSGLGKGRKQASDGGAWMAAAYSAIKELRKKKAIVFSPDTTHGGAGAEMQLVGSDDPAVFLKDILPLQWLEAATRYFLLVSHGLIANIHHPEHAGDLFTVSDDRDGWAAAYEKVLALMSGDQMQASA